MGYDVCAETLLAEKQSFLERARTENALLCFQHDADTAAVRVVMNERGQYGINDPMKKLNP
jgi:hypothetical protein